MHTLGGHEPLVTIRVRDHVRREVGPRWWGHLQGWGPGVGVEVWGRVHGSAGGRHGAAGVHHVGLRGEGGVRGELGVSWRGGRGGRVGEHGRCL